MWKLVARGDFFFPKILGNCWGVVNYLVKQTRPGEQDLDFFLDIDFGFAILFYF